MRRRRWYPVAVAAALACALGAFVVYSTAPVALPALFSGRAPWYVAFPTTVGVGYLIGALLLIVRRRSGAVVATASSIAFLVPYSMTIPEAPVPALLGSLPHVAVLLLALASWKRLNPMSAERGLGTPGNGISSA